jgi:putative intracellular protease/amidase
MKVLFIISSSETSFWLSEVTHPYWHLTERGVEVDFASPAGGKVVYDPYSDPYFEHSTEAEDLVSKGFLSDKSLVAKLETTLKLKDVDLTKYDAVHVAGGRGATFDLYPNADVAKVLEYFWARRKWSALSATAPSPSATSRSAFAAAARRDTPSKGTRNFSACSAAASSFPTFRKRCWKRWARSTRAWRQTIPTLSGTASW